MPSRRPLPWRSVCRRTRSLSSVGRRLGIKPLAITAEWAARYIEDVRERDPLYLREGLSHPGQLPRLLNWALTHNVVLGPWIHVASKVDHFAAARVGDELTVRAKVTANYEKKGHRFVELDGLVLANATTPIARIAHTAIYRAARSGVGVGWVSAGTAAEVIRNSEPRVTQHRASMYRRNTLGYARGSRCAAPARSWPR